ncbi:MAG: cystathionine gamma-synthase family protein [Saprospiraceae bacterium]|nr:cystathionine gamma-synthase family protein [Saprospiraceae bacterium]
MSEHTFHPESLMMSHGYRPEWSEGAIKCPIFQTSTFVFPTAEQGKAHFEVAYGLRNRRDNEKEGLIYSRINNPDLEILENRLAIWDSAEACAVFESGMGAITTVLLEFLQPGDLLLHSTPLYGGSDHFIRHILPRFGIRTQEFHPNDTEEQLIAQVQASGERLAMVFVETPANPTNALYDLQACRAVADHFSTPERRALVAVDNTYMGPLWQHPIRWGADFSIYSATKYIGGHSDVIAGAVCGSQAHLLRLKALRTFLGNMAGPWTGWLLLRSLETLHVRMERQAATAAHVARFLRSHPNVEQVHYLGFLDPEKDARQYDIFRRQCSSAGAMLAFDVKGGEEAAFRVLNRLKLVKLAVSLGSTESLAQHPDTMTHAGVALDHKRALGITPGMIRLSVGVEHPDDLIWDLQQAML